MLLLGYQSNCVAERTQICYRSYLIVHSQSAVFAVEVSGFHMTHKIKFNCILDDD